MKGQVEMNRKEYSKIQKQNTALVKEKERAKEKAEEAEKMHQESKIIIDEKEEKIRETEEELNEKIEENRRWKIKYQYYLTYWEKHQQENVYSANKEMSTEEVISQEKEREKEPPDPVEAPSEPVEAPSDPVEAEQIPEIEKMDPALEIEKLEQKNEKYLKENQQLRRNNKELQERADKRQESIKDLIIQLNKTKKQCMVLEEEKKDLTNINCMLELELDELKEGDFEMEQCNDVDLERDPRDDTLDKDGHKEGDGQPSSYKKAQTGRPGEEKPQTFPSPD